MQPISVDDVKQLYHTHEKATAAEGKLDLDSEEESLFRVARGRHARKRMTKDEMRRKVECKSGGLPDIPNKARCSVWIGA